MSLGTSELILIAPTATSTSTKKVIGRQRSSHVRIVSSNSGVEKSGRRIKRKRWGESFFWHDIELEVLKKHPDMGASDLKNLLPARSLQAIRRKRAELGLPTQRGYRNWYPSDDRQLIEYAKTKGAIEIARLMGRGQGSVRTRAEKLNIKFKSDVSKFVKTGNPLVDAIRQRCEEDGIPVRTLDRLLKTGHYFSGHCMSAEAKARPAIMKHIAKAVEFFGGELTINWKDE